jgi:hypothetical protein
MEGEKSEQNNEKIKSQIASLESMKACEEAKDKDGSISTSKCDGSREIEHTLASLPWGAKREEKKFSYLNLNIIEEKKPGEYLMHLVFHNFVLICNRKIEQILTGDKKVKALLHHRISMKRY